MSKTSYLIGGSLQAVGQVVASGYSVSDSVGAQSLVIKMLRVLMIGPIVMILHLIFHSKNGSAGTKKTYIPGYIIGFMFCAAAAGVFGGDTLVLPYVKTLAGYPNGDCHGCGRISHSHSRLTETGPQSHCACRLSQCNSGRSDSVADPLALLISYFMLNLFVHRSQCPCISHSFQEMNRGEPKGFLPEPAPYRRHK